MSGNTSFHLDEHIASAIVKGLRQRGIKVTTAAEVGLLGAEDVAHLSFAYSQGSVMVTQDQDFLRLNSIGVPHAGIAYCKFGTRTIGQMLYTLTLIYELITPDEAAGQLIYL